MDEFGPKISELEILQEEYQKVWQEILDDTEASCYILITELITRITDSLELKDEALSADKEAEIREKLRILSEKTARVQLSVDDLKEMSPAEVLETGLWILAESNWETPGEVLVLSLARSKEVRLNLNGETIETETQRIQIINKYK